MKYERHARILEIIEQYEIETQEDLAERLRQNGVDVTQATVSRDIKELKLVKVQCESGRYKYSTINTRDNPLSDKLLAVFSNSYVSCDYANNMIVVKTLPGMAQASASAIDSMKWPGILGTIAGDDSIMIVCRAEKIAAELVGRFERLSAAKYDGR